MTRDRQGVSDRPETPSPSTLASDRLGGIEERAHELRADLTDAHLAGYRTPTVRELLAAADEAEDHGDPLDALAIRRAVELMGGDA